MQLTPGHFRTFWPQSKTIKSITCCTSSIFFFGTRNQIKNLKKSICPWFKARLLLDDELVDVANSRMIARFLSAPLSAGIARHTLPSGTATLLPINRLTRGRGSPTLSGLPIPRWLYLVFTVGSRLAKNSSTSESEESKSRLVTLSVPES